MREGKGIYGRAQITLCVCVSFSKEAQCVCIPSQMWLDVEGSVQGGNDHMHPSHTWTCFFHSDALVQSLRKGQRPSGSCRSPRVLSVYIRLRVCEWVCTVTMRGRSDEPDGQTVFVCIYACSRRGWVYPVDYFPRLLLLLSIWGNPVS